jgi:hypothetical protein
MKYVADRPFADPETAARKLIELANAFEPVQDGRIYIEKINAPFLYQLKGTPAEYKAGLDRAMAKGWLVLHESGTYVRFSNRPFEVKHFQTVRHCSVDVAHGLALLFGIGTRALPSWDSRTR